MESKNMDCKSDRGKEQMLGAADRENEERLPWNCLSMLYKISDKSLERTRVI